MNEYFDLMRHIGDVFPHCVLIGKDIGHAPLVIFAHTALFVLLMKLGTYYVVHRDVLQDNNDIVSPHLLIG